MPQDTAWRDGNIGRGLGAAYNGPGPHRSIDEASGCRGGGVVPHRGPGRIQCGVQDSAGAQNVQGFVQLAGGAAVNVQAKRRHNMRCAQEMPRSLARRGPHSSRGGC